MQLMPGTARRFGVTRLHRADQNIPRRRGYLATSWTSYEDLPPRAGGYNPVERGAEVRGIPPYEETGTYVKRAMTVYRGRPYGGSISIAGPRQQETARRFGSGVMQPVAAALIPGAKYLGTH